MFNAKYKLDIKKKVLKHWTRAVISCILEKSLFLITCANKLCTLYRHLLIVCHCLARTLYICVNREKPEYSNEKERGAMLGAEEHGSEVARLLLRISQEYEAAQRGLTGLAFGTSKHEFITAKMENMGQLHSELQSIVGEEAIALIADALESL